MTTIPPNSRKYTIASHSQLRPYIIQGSLKHWSYFEFVHRRYEFLRLVHYYLQIHGKNAIWVTLQLLSRSIIQRRKAIFGIHTKGKKIGAFQPNTHLIFAFSVLVLRCLVDNFQSHPPPRHFFRHFSLLAKLFSFPPHPRYSNWRHSEEEESKKNLLFSSWSSVGILVFLFFFLQGRPGEGGRRHRWGRTRTKAGKNQPRNNAFST